jgi:UDP-glucose 4-epimerase
MKVLVTGGAGYIGSHTAHQLVEAGHQVTVLDNLYSGFEWAVPEQARFVRGDISDAALVQRVIRGEKPEDKIDAIVHFAAHIEVPESVTDPLKYYRNNTVGSQILIQTAFAEGIRKMIFSSTAALYGDAQTPLVNEESPIAPLNPYGTSKWMTEMILRDLSKATALGGDAFRYVALRYFNVAGARLDSKIGQSTPRATHLIKIACETAIGKRDKMFIMGTDYPTPDGTGVRDYIHVEDLARAHLLALEYLDRGGDSDIFCCGYGHGYSVRQVIDTMKKVSGVDFKVEEGPRRPGDSSMIVADSSKIRRILRWTPQCDDLALICKTALDWEKKLATR